jgi:DUF4097 and DUF4098 domain-containing protein YvlB
MENTKLSRSIDIQEGATITVQIENSPLSIRHSETNEIMMSIEINLTNPDQIEKFKNIADKEDLLKDIFNVSGVKTSHITIEIDEEELDQYIERGWNKNFHFTIEIPKDCPLVAENENGSLDVQDLTQIMTLRTENGPIRVKSCQGALNLEAENGPVDISDFSGNITVHMENGPLKVLNARGEVIEIETENGPVATKEMIFNRVNIRGENGPLKIDIPKEVSGTYTIETENGQVQILLAKDSQYDITAETEIGPINLKLSETCQVLENEQDDDFKRIHVTEGNGSLKINIRSETGMIKVTEENAGEKEFRFEFRGDMGHEGIDVSQITNLANTLANQISQSVSVALGKVVKKINVPDLERKLDIERVSEKIQRMGEKLQKAVDPDFDIPEPPEPPEFEEKKGKLKILELLEKGKINADEAATLLRAMQSK